MLLIILGVSGLPVLVTGPGVLLALGLAFAVGLTVASVKLRVDQDPRIDEIDAALPGANCGGCGFAGCAAYAKAVAEGKAPVDGCPVGGTDCATAVAAIMGIQIEAGVAPPQPVVHCGACDADRGRKPYNGVARCSEANLIAGLQGCAFGCMGFGDCVDSCKFGALKMENGLPTFDYEKCTSCGACVNACPRLLIEMIPFKQEAMLVVACKSQDPGKIVRQVCNVGCIGCSACTKKSDVFTMTGNLADVDYEKYENVEALREAFDKCPTAVMAMFGPDGRIPVHDAYPKEEAKQEKA